MEAKESIIRALLATPFGQIYRMVYSSSASLEPMPFAQFAAQTIGVSLRLENDDPSHEHPELSVLGFGAFVEVERGKIELRLEEQALRPIRAQAPRPLNIPGMKPWNEIISAPKLDIDGMWHVLAEALFAAFKQERGIQKQYVFILEPRDRQRAAEIMFMVFFETLINTLALGKTVELWDMKIAYDANRNKIDFVPDEGMLRSAELFHLRKIPLPPVSRPNMEYAVGELSSEDPGPPLLPVRMLFYALGALLFSLQHGPSIVGSLLRRPIKFYRTHILPKPPRGISKEKSPRSAWFD